ncbi:hypothetical protein [Burkholderia ubonensis]|uniref:hypothetical protein n=1 Tax=Burkholderia ubonensis TaxID=101571 RepID=UPI0009B3FF7E|nr:hypothetical protein [Burkholderia ubonensis]
MPNFTKKWESFEGASLNSTVPQVANLFMACRYHHNAQHKREVRAQAFATWEWVSCARWTG